MSEKLPIPPSFGHRRRAPVVLSCKYLNWLFCLLTYDHTAAASVDVMQMYVFPSALIHIDPGAYPNVESVVAPGAPVAFRLCLTLTAMASQDVFELPYLCHIFGLLATVEKAIEPMGADSPTTDGLMSVGLISTFPSMDSPDRILCKASIGNIP